MNEMFQNSFVHLVAFEMTAIVGVFEDQAGDGFYVRVEWVGFDQDGN